MLSRYEIVSGVIFGVIALAQLVRAVNQWPVQIGSFNVPVLASWIAALVAGSICVWAFGSNRK